MLRRREPMRRNELVYIAALSALESVLGLSWQALARILSEYPVAAVGRAIHAAHYHAVPPRSHPWRGQSPTPAPYLVSVIDSNSGLIGSVRVHASSSTAADSTSSRSVSVKRAAGAPSITAWSKLSVNGSMGRTTT